MDILHKRTVWTLFVLTAWLLGVNKVYYTLYPNQLSVQPLKLSLVNEETHDLEFIKRNSTEGKAIIKKMYGGYAEHIINSEELEISTPSSAEFTVPQFELNKEAYVLREHPALRYELWKQEAPNVILLGSSIFFCGFNREVFFETYPDKKLLDFTTGNNTPFIANYFMQRADSLRLNIKPGTVVLYGMNRVEMLEGYKDKHSHDFVKEALTGGAKEHEPDEQIAAFLKFPELRYDMTNGLKHLYDDLFRGNNVYRKEVDSIHIESDKAFTKYQRSVAPEYTGTKVFDKERVEELIALNNYLGDNDCKLIVLKLPQSLYNDIAMNTQGYSYFDQEMEQLKAAGISYVDVSDMQTYNIRQTDYLWPGNIFDPEHLNVHGAKRFTRSLINQVLDTAFTQNDNH